MPPQSYICTRKVHSFFTVGPGVRELLDNRIVQTQIGSGDSVVKALLQGIESLEARMSRGALVFCMITVWVAAKIHVAACSLVCWCCM
jgi:hypothetical protein